MSLLVLVWFFLCCVFYHLKNSSICGNIIWSQLYLVGTIMLEEDGKRWCGACGRYEDVNDADDFAILRVAHQHFDGEDENDVCHRNHVQSTENARQMLGKPSMEVLHGMPLIPSLHEDALHCVGLVTRSAETLRSFQIEMAMLFQSVGLTKYGDSLIRFVPEHAIPEENYTSNSDMLLVAPKMDFLLKIMLSVLGRVQMVTKQAIQDKQQSFERELVALTRKVNTLTQENEQHKQAIFELKADLGMEQKKGNALLYSWPSISNDDISLQQIKKLEKTNALLMEDNENLANEVEEGKKRERQLLQEVQTLKQSILQQRLDSSSHNFRPSQATLKHLKRNRHIPQTTLTSPSRMQSRQGGRLKSQYTLSQEQQHQQQIEDLVELEEGIRGSSIHTPPPDFGITAYKQEQLHHHQFEQHQQREKLLKPKRSYTEYAKLIPDLKLACLFANYILHCRGEMLRDESSQLASDTSRRHDLIMYRILMWRKKRVETWKNRLKNIQDIERNIKNQQEKQLPTTKNPLVAEGDYTLNNVDGNKVQDRRRRTSLLGGEGKQWRRDLETRAEKQVDASWFVTPQALVVQTQRAHKQSALPYIGKQQRQSSFAMSTTSDDDNKETSRTQLPSTGDLLRRKRSDGKKRSKSIVSPSPSPMRESLQVQQLQQALMSTTNETEEKNILSSSPPLPSITQGKVLQTSNKRRSSKFAANSGHESDESDDGFTHEGARKLSIIGRQSHMLDESVSAAELIDTLYSRPKERPHNLACS
eukprot:m.32797 g.32797  ORF g.32797 m.32797 type:complete len:759 (+) comp6411_c0_seq1:159-2435(+)